MVALDFDGVLNPLVFDSSEGFTEHRLHIAADDVLKTQYIRRDPDGGVSTTVFINREHGKWITNLREMADVVWATILEHLAKTPITPMLGTGAATLVARWGFDRVSSGMALIPIGEEAR